MHLAFRRSHANRAAEAAGEAVGHFRHGAHAIGRSRDELIGELQDLVDAGRKMVASSADVSNAALSSARDRFNASLDSAQTLVGDMSQSARARGVRALKATDTYVHDNPYWVLVGVAGLALGLGLLFAMGTRR